MFVDVHFTHRDWRKRSNAGWGVNRQCRESSFHEESQIDDLVAQIEEPLRKPLTHQTRDDVVPSAGGKPNNQAHRPMDRLAPMRCTRRPGARQHPLPDAKNFGGEVSWQALAGDAKAIRIPMPQIRAAISGSTLASAG